MNWLAFALASAFFAALTAILGKIAVNDINSNLATCLRTVIIVLMTTGIVAWRHEWQSLADLSRRSLLMLCCSAIATGFSWLCYWRAMQLGSASRVAPIDKFSIVFVILFSVLFLGEALTWKMVLGGTLIVAGAILLAM